MNRKQFWQHLRTQFGYQTPEYKGLPFEKIPRLATGAYYARVIHIIYQNARIARQGRYNKNIWADGSVDIINAAESIGGRLTVFGVEGIMECSGPVVFISNHMSMIDAFFLPAIVSAFKDVTFVVKQSLLDYPIFGNIMQAIRPIAVTRKNPREDLKAVLNQGRDRLAQGCSVIVFPQATRSSFFDGAHFNSLGVKLARRAGVPIIPVALKTDFQGHGDHFKDFGLIDPSKNMHIQFGLPIQASNGNSHKKVVDFISKNLQTWGTQVQNVN